MRNLSETKQCSRNFIKEMNTWGVRLLGYWGSFFKWTREELQQMNRRTRKLMTMQKVKYLRDDLERLYMPRKEGGRGICHY